MKEGRLIASLECCSNVDRPCYKCPGISNGDVLDCTRSICAESLKFLKPRVLTLEEAYDAEIVWYESRCVYDSAWGKLSPGDTKVSTAITRLGHNGWAYEDDRDYGSAWRCWSKHPSDEQRKATAWKRL